MEKDEIERQRNTRISHRGVGESGKVENWKG
jgi:hypothetical protein